MSSTAPERSALAGALALVGFMGAGKTQVGLRVASRLGLPFVDTDALIEDRHGAISDFFASHGEQAFRRLERDIVCAALAASAERPCVLSLGGGAVLSGDVREALARVPHVVWLTASADVLWRRVRDHEPDGRPLARDEAGFRRLLEERSALYASVATERVANDGPTSLDDVAAAVARLVVSPAGSRRSTEPEDADTRRSGAL
jgi:shikimate kinase